MTINEIQDDIIESFAELDDWMDKYQLLIDMGNGLPAIPEAFKKPEYLIEGCQSRVWVVAHYDREENIIHFEAESDTVIVKGLVSLLLRVFDGRSPEEILSTELYFIDRVGLSEHLSPTRSNGLLAMVRQIRDYALVFNGTK